MHIPTIGQPTRLSVCLGAVLLVSLAWGESPRAHPSSQESTGQSPRPEDLVRHVESTFVEIQSRYVARAEKEKSFEIDEKGANLYLRHRAKTDLAEGVSNPWIRLEEGKAVLGARIDLDSLKSEMPDNMMLRLLSGIVPVELAATLDSQEGSGMISLERVSVSGIELPTSFVEDLARQHGTAGFLPPGFRLGESFPLPYDLEEIRLAPQLLKIKQRGASRLSSR